MTAPVPNWEGIRATLQREEPTFYDIEPGGALGLALDDAEWLLELTPDGRLICQTGLDMEDIQSLLSDGTPEELNTDELAKQAKYYLQPSVSKFRDALLHAGFQESTEMTEQYVAATFQRPVDLHNLSDVMAHVRWCQERFKSQPSRP